MAVFSVNEASNYGGQGGGGFFRLADDHDTAKIRFLYNGIEDVQGMSVHEVDVGGKNRFVNCLREYGSPVDACPFCAKGMFTTAKYFIPIYNIDEGKTQIWQRGKQFGGKLTSICSRFSNLVSHIFDVERIGKKGDTQTTYEIYETDADDATLEDFDVPNILGSVVLNKDAEEMEYYLKHGDFPDTRDGGDAEEEAPIRRRSERRTPAHRDRGEAF